MVEKTVKRLRVRAGVTTTTTMISVRAGSRCFLDFNLLSQPVRTDEQLRGFWCAFHNDAFWRGILHADAEGLEVLRILLTWLAGRPVESHPSCRDHGLHDAFRGIVDNGLPRVTAGEGRVVLSKVLDDVQERLHIHVNLERMQRLPQMLHCSAGPPGEG